MVVTSVWNVVGAIMGRRRQAKASLAESRDALRRSESRDAEIDQVTRSLNRHMRINHLSEGFAHIIQERRK